MNTSERNPDPFPNRKSRAVSNSRRKSARIGRGKPADRAVSISPIVQVSQHDERYRIAARGWWRGRLILQKAESTRRYLYRGAITWKGGQCNGTDKAMKESGWDCRLAAPQRGGGAFLRRLSFLSGLPLSFFVYPTITGEGTGSPSRDPGASRFVPFRVTQQK